MRKGKSAVTMMVHSVHGIKVLSSIVKKKQAGFYRNSGFVASRLFDWPMALLGG